MYNFGKLVLNINMVITSVWIVERFWGTFFEKRKYSIFSLLTWLIFCSFQFFRNKGEIKTGITIINIGLIFLISIVCYSYAGKEKLFLLLVFYSLWSLIELFVFFFISSFIKKTYINEIGMVISNILIVLLVHIISNILEKKRISFRSYTILLCFATNSSREHFYCC